MKSPGLFNFNHAKHEIVRTWRLKAPHPAGTDP
ncbi:hypothetical protein M2447_002359 [Ereboglobus sp. PH5-10]|nr:hypothetical protein [Ereboglobus sp. PH5-10]